MVGVALASPATVAADRFRMALFACSRIGRDGIVVAAGGAHCESAGGTALSMALPAVASSTACRSNECQRLREHSSGHAGDRIGNRDLRHLLRRMSPNVAHHAEE